MHKELKLFLKREKMSRREMARRLGIDHSLVSRWASGHRKPSRELIPAVVEMTGIPVEKML